MSTKESILLLRLDDSYFSRPARMGIVFRGQEHGNIRGRGTETEHGCGTGTGNEDGERRRVITRKEMTAALTGDG